MEPQPNQPHASNPKSAPTAWAVIIVIILVLGVGSYFLFKKDGSNTNNANTSSNANQLSNINETAGTNSAANRNTNTSANINSNINATSNTNLVSNKNNASNTNTSVDTTGWKTYSNSNAGFELMYPSDWKVSERIDGSIVFAPVGGSFPEVSVKRNSSDSTSRDLLKSSLQGINLVESSETNIIIDGLAVFVREGFSATPLADGSSWYIQRAVIDAASQIYEVNGDNASSVFLKMLKSFQKT